MKLSISSVFNFLREHGHPMSYLKKYGRLLSSYGRAWDSGDIDAIIDHFADDFVYTDLLVQSGLRSKTELRNHLNIVFERFPKQKWTKNATMYPHFTPRKFAIFYEFRLESKDSIFTGSGMEKIEFCGNKIIEDRIHLEFNEIDSRKVLGFSSATGHPISGGQPHAR